MTPEIITVPIKKIKKGKLNVSIPKIRYVDFQIKL